MMWRGAISKFISASEDDTRRFAADFARRLKGGEKICLVGPFGSGKTTFVRGFVQAFGISPGDVQSPTFTLVREYKNNQTIYHIDLYRLEKEDDIFEAGIYELLTGETLVLIEWADHLQKYRPHPCVTVLFSHGNGDERIIEVTEN